MLIDKVIDIYTWIVIASAIMSWLVAFGVINVRNQFIRVVVDLLYRLTEPLLRPIRRFLPNLGGVDISPIILLLGLVLHPEPSARVCLAGADPLKPAADPPFLRRTGAGVTIELRAQPRARRCLLSGAARGALKAAVTAPAEDGKANKAVIELLAARMAAAEIRLRGHARRRRARQGGEHFRRARFARRSDWPMDAGAGEG